MAVVKPWLLLLTFLCATCSSSHILVFYPGPSGSLLRSFTTLFQELFHRGHQITVVTGHELTGLQNYTIPQLLLGRPLDNSDIKAMTTPFLPYKIYYYWETALKDCDILFKNPKFIEFLNSNETYDLFIGSPFYFLECSIAVAHYLKLPFLNIFSNTIPIHFSHQAGYLFPYSYVTDLDLPFTHNMNFFQRLTNTVFCLGYSLGLSFYYMPRMDAVMRQYFPHVPPLQEMLSQVPVTLLNTNLAVHPVQPLLPGIVPVGGLTIPLKAKAPEELLTWMDASEQGVILFSLGSNIKVTSLDPEKLKVIVEVFGKLQHRVLMKWETDHLDGKPDNVRLSKWIPQAAILSHPHCKLMMTHGGLHTWMEAVHYSVPLLGLFPSFFDQEHNLAEIQERGHGLYFKGPWDQTNLFEAINEVLHNPKYKENIQKASEVFRDQPLNPLQKAVYWTEYMMRHGDASHLQTSATSMPWYKVMLLDIIATLLISLLVIMFLVHATFKFLMRYLVEYTTFNRTLKVSDKLKTK